MKADYEIKCSWELRPCMVDDKKALFHKWNTFKNVIEASLLIGGAPAGQIEYTSGMVEFEDGSIKEVSPGRIKFLDHIHRNYAFED